MLDDLQTKPDKLDLLVRLIAISLTQGKKQREQVKLLSIAGMGPKEIAGLLGTSPNTVNVTLSALRKENKLNLKSEEE
jgi:DNA-binding CsgD family transcriptional regulator